MREPEELEGPTAEEVGRLRKMAMRIASGFGRGAYEPKPAKVYANVVPGSRAADRPTGRGPLRWYLVEVFDPAGRPLVNLGPMRKRPKRLPFGLSATVIAAHADEISATPVNPRFARMARAA